MVMQFMGSVILLLAFFGLSDSFTLEGVIWFTIGLCFVAPHVVHDLIKEITHRVK
jgi:hypothetical protein